MRYDSALLFHGPGAKEASEAFLPTVGRVLTEPFGQCGLKIEEARQIIELMLDSPLGDDPGVVWVGPLDVAAQNATDVLLKCLEEFDPDIVRPVLWANDLGAVSDTIVSRCLHRWCPESSSKEDQEGLIRIAFELVDAATSGDDLKVVELLLEGAKDLELYGLLESAAQALAVEYKQLVGLRFALWERLRTLGLRKSVSRTELLAAFLGDGHEL